MANVVLVASGNELLESKLRCALADLTGDPRVESCDRDELPMRVQAVAANFSDHCAAVFLGVDEDEKSIAMLNLLRRRYADLNLVAVVPPEMSNFVMKAVRSGASEVIADVRPADLRRAYLHGLKSKADQPRDLGRLVVFWSAQSAAGASTVASQTALTLGGAYPGDVLMIDLDFHSGIVAERLGLRPTFHLADLGPNGRLAANDWKQAICRHSDVDLIAAPPSSSALKISGMPPLVELVQRVVEEHKLVIVDLPTSSRGSSRDVLNIADRIYLVTTPELNSLYLASKKIAELKSMSVSADRVHLLMNRTGEYRGLTRADVELAVGVAISHELPNDYLTVSQSIVKRSRIESATALGKGIGRLAETIDTELIRPASKTAPTAVARGASLATP